MYIAVPAMAGIVSASQKVRCTFNIARNSEACSIDQDIRNVYPFWRSDNHDLEQVTAVEEFGRPHSGRSSDLHTERAVS